MKRDLCNKIVRISTHYEHGGGRMDGCMDVTPVRTTPHVIGSGWMDEQTYPTSSYTPHINGISGVFK